MIYNSVTEILREYPRKNSKWMPLDTMFTAEVSDLSEGELLLDPWNREFHQPPMIIRDADNDVVYWDYVTTVNGHKLICRVFND